MKPVYPDDSPDIKESIMLTEYPVHDTTSLTSSTSSINSQSSPSTHNPTAVTCIDQIISQTNKLYTEFQSQITSIDDNISTLLNTIEKSNNLQEILYQSTSFSIDNNNITTAKHITDEKNLWQLRNDTTVWISVIKSQLSVSDDWLVRVLSIHLEKIYYKQVLSNNNLDYFDKRHKYDLRSILSQKLKSFRFFTKTNPYLVQPENDSTFDKIINHELQTILLFRKRLDLSRNRYLATLKTIYYNYQVLAASHVEFILNGYNKSMLTACKLLLLSNLFTFIFLISS